MRRDVRGARSRARRRLRLKVRIGRLVFLGGLAVLALMAWHDKSTAALLLGAIDMELV